jgi:type II secretory pathway pseudopilin PulG
MTGHTKGDRSRTGPGFTVLEVTVALVIMLMAMMLVTQAAIWTLGQRERDASRQEALEAAINIMEKARALAWNDISAQWASTQRLTDDLTQRLTEARLVVNVEPVANHSHTKRVTVEIKWKDKNEGMAQQVQLVSLFNDRSAEVPGGKP